MLNEVWPNRVRTLMTLSKLSLLLLIPLFSYVNTTGNISGKIRIVQNQGVRIELIRFDQRPQGANQLIPRVKGQHFVSSHPEQTQKHLK